MELSDRAIDRVIHPTAAFPSVVTTPSVQEEPDSWLNSPLNPKNRIDSLDVLEKPLWRIDGCTAFGTQFYAVPVYMAPLAPLRVDLFIPSHSDVPKHLRGVLDLDVAFHTRSAKRIAHLGITRHLLRLLQSWTIQGSFSAQQYARLSWGTRIVLDKLSTRVEDCGLRVSRQHQVEMQLLSLESLRHKWPDVTFPPTLNIHELEYVSQIHDSVSLVRYGGQSWIFKAITSHTRFMYHELRNLLTVPPHQNIISRPVHLVTKPCGFGGKTGVLGFMLEYHSRGSVRDLIPFYRLHNLTTLADEVKWSYQLASALLHLRETSDIFYPDLRLDNIVLTDSGDVVMVDFEQRGVWCEFAAPEVNAIDYMRLVATSKDISEENKARYANILGGLLPNWEDKEKNVTYSMTANGYNTPWSCLTAKEQEACEVYMLGRVLWCIFEAQSAPQKAAVWVSYLWEPAHEFPLYTRTPKPMRDLINNCTKGRKVGLSHLIVREKDKLVLSGLDTTIESTPQQVQDEAQAWWLNELDLSERWIERRSEGLQNGTWNQNYYNRPTLAEVRNTIRAFAVEIGLAV
ncbi:hypothetical protein B0I35DRAFT_473691 [Stachybotrys elegans]|uniref:EKC/KEOPS complex subunit BUD32 n=1 Tax=Stachybotrys elegans TaxID=80388 RepID=A0A8K0T8D1_9HYPO|nr:hypothetical protein B0I35DRAFT_473691 [Stachybotrys elegans]